MNLFDNIVNRPILPQYAQEKFRATSSQMQPQPMQQAQPNLFDKYMQDSSISANGKKAMQEDLQNGVITQEQADKIITDIYAKRQTQEQTKQKPEREWFVQNVWGFIWDVVGGAIEQVPRALWNIAEFGSKVWQYTPFSLWATAIQAWFSDKTFWQLREEQKAQAEKLWQIWESWSEFVQKYGAYDPTTVWASLGRTWVEIWASLVWPNKVWAIQKLWKLATPTKIAMEWGLAWAKYDIASKWEITPTSVWVGAWLNLWVAWAFKWWQKVAQAFMPKTAEQKLVSALRAETTKWIVAGKKVNVPVPQEWVLTKITIPFRESDTKRLVWKALTPSYAWKTPKQIMKTVSWLETTTKDFYNLVRTWKLKGSIDTLEDSANTVITNLDEIGANIGKSIKETTGKISPSKTFVSDANAILKNKVEKLSWAYWPLKKFLEFSKKPMSIQDAFKLKKVYQAEIWKLVKSGDVWTESYETLLKWVQELSDSIDSQVMKLTWPKFAEYKKNYSLLKKLASDITKSAQVEWRRSPQTFIEQVSTLEAISEWISNPLSTAKQLFAKEIWELNTRGWAWKELIKNWDKEAIKKAKLVKPFTKTPIVAPKKVQKPSSEITPSATQARWPIDPTTWKRKTIVQSPTAYEAWIRRPYTLNGNKPIVKRASDNKWPSMKGDEVLMSEARKSTMGDMETKKIKKPKALRVYDVIKSKNNDITAVPFDDFYSLARVSTKWMTKDKAWWLWMNKILQKVKKWESIDIEILKKYPLAGAIIKDFLKTRINPFE